VNYTNTTTTINNTFYKMGKIDYDPTSYVDKLFIPVRTGLIPLNSKTLALRITVQDGLINNVNTTDFWGIN
jgi:hypothetical protein